MRMTAILAGLAMIAMAAPARAGGGLWGPIAGDGEVTDATWNTTPDFATAAGWLRLEYEPPAGEDPVPTGYLELVGLGPAVPRIVADQQIQETMVGDEVWITAMYGLGGTITAQFEGDPSDIASLQLVGISVSPSYHGEPMVWFWGGPIAGPAAAVPKPLAASLLAVGTIWAALLWRRRRGRPR